MKSFLKTKRFKLKWSNDSKMTAEAKVHLQTSAVFQVIRNNSNWKKKKKKEFNYF